MRESSINEPELSLKEHAGTTEGGSHLTASHSYEIESFTLSFQREFNCRTISYLLCFERPSITLPSACFDHTKPSALYSLETDDASTDWHR